MYRDASEIELDLYRSGDNDWFECPLTGQDGQVAALLTMLSESKASCSLDPEQTGVTNSVPLLLRYLSML
jgi:hypothetical protein